MKYNNYWIEEFSKNLRRITKFLFFLLIFLLIININVNISLPKLVVILMAILGIYSYFKKNYVDFYISCINIWTFIILGSLFIFSKLIPYIIRWWKEINWLSELWFTNIWLAVSYILYIWIWFVILFYSFLWMRKLEKFIRKNNINHKKNIIYIYIIKFLEFFKKI